MTTPPHILSVGNDSTLLASRTLILRGAGYFVEEAYTVDKAINLVAADSIDAMLICHTIARSDQQVLISAVREKRRLMPILCLRSYAYESAPLTCTAVDKEPEALLHTLKLAIAPPMQIDGQGQRDSRV
jgi:DNA-binding NtrC family response regulator